MVLSYHAPLLGQIPRRYFFLDFLFVILALQALPPFFWQVKSSPFDAVSSYTKKVIYGALILTSSEYLKNLVSVVALGVLQDII